LDADHPDNLVSFACRFTPYRAGRRGPDRDLDVRRRAAGSRRRFGVRAQNPVPLQAAARSSGVGTAPVRPRARLAGPFPPEVRPLLPLHGPRGRHRAGAARLPRRAGVAGRGSPLTRATGPIPRLAFTAAPAAFPILVADAGRPLGNDQTAHARLGWFAQDRCPLNLAPAGLNQRPARRSPPTPHRTNAWRSCATASAVRRRGSVIGGRPRG